MSVEIHSIKSFLKYFSSIRGRTNRIIGEIPEEKINWAPSETSFSFAEIIIHIANTEYEVYIQNIMQRKSIYSGHQRNGILTKHDLIRYLEKNHEKTLEELLTLSDKDLHNRCETAAGASISIWKLLRVMIEHEIHHRGQIFTYLNLLGIKTTPIFGLRSEELSGSQGGD